MGRRSPRVDPTWGRTCALVLHAPAAAPGWQSATGTWDCQTSRWWYGSRSLTEPPRRHNAPAVTSCGRIVSNECGSWNVLTMKIFSLGIWNLISGIKLKMKFYGITLLQKMMRASLIRNFENWFEKGFNNFDDGKYFSYFQKVDFERSVTSEVNMN